MINDDVEKSGIVVINKNSGGKVITNKDGYLVDPLSATKEFYTIDNNENFIKFTKVELEIEDDEDMITESEYYSSLRTPNPQ